MKLIQAMLEETSEDVFFNPAKIVYAKTVKADGEDVYTDILLEDGTKLYRPGSVRDLNDQIKEKKGNEECKIYFLT